MRAATLMIPAMVALFAGAAMAGHGGKLPFTEQYEETLVLAQKTGKPVALYFTAEW